MMRFIGSPLVQVRTLTASCLRAPDKVDELCSRGQAGLEVGAALTPYAQAILRHRSNSVPHRLRYDADLTGTPLRRVADRVPDGDELRRGESQATAAEVGFAATSARARAA